jgi:hypothetical protein
MRTALIPDAEKVVSKYLREHADVVPLGTRFVGKTPDDITSSWVRVTQLDASPPPDSRADHLIRYLLQFDVYAGAGGQPEANLNTRTIRAALNDMPGLHDDAVVTAVRFAGQLRRPDTDFENARERVILTAQIWAHAAPAS